MKIRSFLFSLLAIYCPCLWGEQTDDHQVDVQLKSPTYSDGVIETHQGGTLVGKDIRIQATHIRYVKKKDQSQWVVEAWGNLFVRYGSQPFVADRLIYNFNERSGILFEGRTQLGCWFLGGQEIELCADNTYKLKKTSITTCESGKGMWEIRVNKASVKDYDILKAAGATVRVLKVPIFWYPYLRVRLSTLKDIPARYSFITGGSQGQRMSLRYLAYASQALKAYLQLDFWFKKGPSGSAQFDYKTPNHPTCFQANNFLAYDKQGSNPPGGAPRYNMFRQRYVGELNTLIAKKLRINGQYERLSDAYVLETYFNRYYYLHTMRHTQVEFRMHEKLWLSYLRSKVRINRFQTVNQELPIFHFNIKPVAWAKLGLISQATLSLGYLDYVFGSFVDQSFANYRSPRLEFTPKAYWPFHFWGFSVTPYGQYIGVGYGQSPRSRPQWNTLGLVGAEANYKLSKIYNNKIRHTVEPYVSYEFMTNPTVAFRDHYLFDTKDAFAKNNQLRWGLRNYLFVKRKGALKNPLAIDVYAYGFFNNKTIGSYIPRFYVELTQQLPHVFTAFGYAQNVQHHKIDFINVRTAITISEDLAFSFLFMHRSAFDYRKANHDNFLLDVFRRQNALLASPLSDRRNIAQTKIYWRILRDLIFEFHSRHGWLRRNSPPFNEMRFDATFLLPCNWRFRFSPQRTISPNKGAKYVWRLHFSLQLGGSAPSKQAKPFTFW